MPKNCSINPFDRMPERELQQLALQYVRLKLHENGPEDETTGRGEIRRVLKNAGTPPETIDLFLQTLTFEFLREVCTLHEFGN